MKTYLYYEESDEEYSFWFKNIRISVDKDELEKWVEETERLVLEKTTGYHTPCYEEHAISFNEYMIDHFDSREQKEFVGYLISEI